MLPHRDSETWDVFASQVRAQKLSAGNAGLHTSRATPKGNKMKHFSVQMFTQLQENGPLTKPQRVRELWFCGQRRRAETSRQTPQLHPCPCEATQGAKAVLVTSWCVWGEAAHAKHAATAQERTSSWQTLPHAEFHQLRSQY